MCDFLLYNLKAGACLAAFYLFYKLLLSRETLHRFNRMLLIGLTLWSFALPLCVVTIRKEVAVDPAVLQTVSAPRTAGELTAAEAGAPGPGERLAGLLFTAGIAAALLRCCGAVLSVAGVIRRSERTSLGGRLVLARYPGEIAPFSWMRYVVISRRDYAENGEAIIAHERAHLRLGHSCDLLLTDVLGAVQWFNPAMWLLRRELRAIHEYEADEAVIRSGVDAKTYQLLLIRKAVGGRWCSVANSFNHSRLKNRITMMLRKRSSRWSTARALFVVPLTCAALGAFAETVYLLPEDKGKQKNGMMCTVTVTNDANACIGINIDGRTCVVVDGRPVERFDFDRFRAEHSYWNMNAYAKGDREYVRRCRSYGVKSRKFDRLIEIVTQPEAVEHSVGKEARVFRIGGGSAATGVKVTASEGPLSSSDKLQPLILIDGRIVRMTMAEIDPETICSIEVLKGPDSVERYGEKGNNGVILITTKAAKARVIDSCAVRRGDGEALRLPTCQRSTD